MHKANETTRYLQCLACCRSLATIAKLNAIFRNQESQYIMLVHLVF